MRWIIMAMLLVVPPQLMAASPLFHEVVAASSKAQQGENYVPKQRVRIKRSKAAALVRRSYPKSKILTISLLESKGPPVYKVKTLRDGVVKHVYVDAVGGEVFD